MKKRIALLGATGSIGKSALDIIARDRENFEVVLLSAHSKSGALLLIKKGWPQAQSALTGEKDGMEKLLNKIKELKPDITINGIAGSAGLEPSIAAIEAGSCLALANKETIAMAGEYVQKLAAGKKVKIIPVDSEHSAIFKLLEAFNKSGNPINNKETADSSFLIDEIILTASGGPFRDYSPDEMKNITPESALSHPTWKMGPKITIDSATMANKGLEVIEACYLFKLPPEKIKVVIHPQSIVHSMIRLCNGCVYAQLSNPDMRHPIHDALYWPDTAPLSLDFLDFDELSLDFKKPDFEKFQMLGLAYKAAAQGGLYPCAYNAANEEAVGAFRSGKISFLDISAAAEYVLEKNWPLQYNSIEEVLNTNGRAKEEVLSFINKTA